MVNITTTTFSPVKNVRIISGTLVIGAILSHLWGLPFMISNQFAFQYVAIQGAVFSVLVLNLVAYWLAPTHLPIAFCLLYGSLDLALLVVVLAMPHLIFFGLVFVTLNIGLLTLYRPVLIFQSIFTLVAALSLWLVKPELLSDTLSLGWFVLVGLAALICNLFVASLDKALKVIAGQVVSLTALLAEKEQKQQVAEEVNQQVTKLAGLLKSLTRQQANATQQQVSATAQVTTGLEELFNIAAQIATAASEVLNEAQHSFTVATQVEQAATDVQQVTTEGLAAVDRAIGTVKKLSGQIEMLQGSLVQVASQTDAITVINQQTSAIAAETHLIALNATIEAGSTAAFAQMLAAPATVTPSYSNQPSSPSGSSQPSTTTTLTEPELNHAAAVLTASGERFGVVAHAVKALAERSRQDSKTSHQLLQNLQTVVTTAKLMAQEGQQATDEAGTAVQQAGEVIQRLARLVESNAAHAATILGAVEVVVQRCREISEATTQQRIASQQILEAVRDLTKLAQHGATESELALKTAEGLGEASLRLSLDEPTSSPPPPPSPNFQPSAPKLLNVGLTFLRAKLPF